MNQRMTQSERQAMHLRPVEQPPHKLRTSNFALRNGFTLIELLVVIAIISLLVSILLPSLQKARELAKATVCLSNMRNIGLGMVMYQENYKYLPYYFSWAETYVEKGTLICPEDRDAGLSSTWVSGMRDIPYSGTEATRDSADLDDFSTGVSYWTRFIDSMWKNDPGAAELYRNDYAGETNQGAYHVWGLDTAYPGLYGENFNFARCNERLYHSSEYGSTSHDLTPAGNVVIYEPADGNVWSWPECYLLPGY